MLGRACRGREYRIHRADWFQRDRPRHCSSDLTAAATAAILSLRYAFHSRRVGAIGIILLLGIIGTHRLSSGDATLITSTERDFVA